MGNTHTKIYDASAEIFKKHIDKYNDNELTAGEYFQTLALIKDFMLYFKEDNPNFKASYFVEQCGVSKEMFPVSLESHGND